MKSDFLDALSKAENQVRDYQSQLEALNDNFQKVGKYMLLSPITFHSQLVLTVKFHRH